MIPNVITTDKGHLKTIRAIKQGGLLVAADRVIGLAARDITGDKVLNYSSYRNTEDVMLYANFPGRVYADSA